MNVLKEIVDPSLQHLADKVLDVGFGLIYVALNTVTDKMYVGLHARGKTRITCRTARWTAHTKKSSHCVRLRNSIAFHGADKFSWYVIEHVPISILKERESFWIAKLNTIDPNGYNLTTGGERVVFCQKTIDKIKQYRNSPEYIAALKKRRRREWDEDHDRFVEAMAKGKRESAKFRQARVDQWKNKSDLEVTEWVRKHKEAAAAKRQARLDACESEVERQKLLKYFAKLERTKELQALTKAGLHVVKPRGPNTGRARDRIAKK
jgi:group I intron endonuclease